VGSLSPWHWAILAVVMVMLFGAKRLPDAARSLGKSLRIFKAEVRELHSESKPGISASQAAPATPAAPAAPVQDSPPACEGSG
jgi:sec-independent protein translocase protein TatA